MALPACLGWAAGEGSATGHHGDEMRHCTCSAKGSANTRYLINGRGALGLGNLRVEFERDGGTREEVTLETVSKGKPPKRAGGRNLGHVTPRARRRETVSQGGEEEEEESLDIRILEAKRLMGSRKWEVVTGVGSCKPVQEKWWGKYLGRRAMTDTGGFEQFLSPLLCINYSFIQPTFPELGPLYVSFKATHSGSFYGKAALECS